MSAVASGELTALSAFELGKLLNEIDRDYDRLTPQAVDAEKALARAEVTLLFEPSNKTAAAEVKTQRAFLRSIAHQTRHLNKRQSRIQSILKSMSITGAL